ncbi:MAG: DUF4190 domain-containing protein [Bacteroidales bacterium]
MKKLYYRNLFILICFASLQVLVSCRTSEKAAVSCPRIPDTRYSYKGRHEAGKQLKHDLYSIDRTRQRKTASTKRSAAGNASTPAKLKIINERGVKNDKAGNKDIVMTDLDRHEYLKGLSASLDNKDLVMNSIAFDSPSPSKRQKITKVKLFSAGQQELCDTIVSTLGDVIIGKVTDVGEKEIQYKRCGINDNKTYSILKSNISVIRYADGKKDLFPGSGPAENGKSGDQRQTEGLGMAGFAIGIAGIFVIGIPFGLLAVILGFISLHRIKKNPDRLMGRGYAIASVVLGIVDIAVIIVLLALKS